MTPNLATFLLGLGTGLGLIAAIGAQNVFVLKQGLLRRHVLVVAATATLCDVALIFLGIGGVGALIAGTPWLTRLAAWGGAAFLVAYGLRSLQNAARAEPRGWSEVAPTVDTPTSRAWAPAVGATLAISLLNPHVYLDTVILLGNLGAQLPAGQRLWFALGASVASALWFHGLGFAAGLLAPLFRSPRMVRSLELLVALVMFAIAFYLLRGAI